MSTDGGVRSPLGGAAEDGHDVVFGHGIGRLLWACAEQLIIISNTHRIDALRFEKE